ncbi:DUF5365 family protein [Thalassobacillus pellis]|uniref:DUF5365 family protein n=1 Tax=Thalassobacillus pellis TaxID=748008 RepID=UPI00195FF28A|nr:DUF5365 family protein [Thalassobacillus pellis]MBM7552536.1 hypothetical protein [Thalassobacillus pellis]
MKVINGATDKQIEELTSLWTYFQENILPAYFSQAYMEKLDQADIFLLPELEAKDQGDIISMTIALQTLIHLLLPGQNVSLQSEKLFHENKQILESHGLSFPFDTAVFDFPNENSYGHH